MNTIGFNNDMYIRKQSEMIGKRISEFGGKLYLEFGGKLFDDFHASRVLPGFAPDAKLRMLMQLSDQAEIVMAISAADIEKNKIRGDLGITYDSDVLRLIDEFRGRGLYVGSVVITQYAGQHSADAFKKRLQKLGIPLLELRGVDGRSFTQLTDAEVDAVGEKLRRAGVGLSALGTPIGKIAVTDDFEAHKALLGRIMDIGDYLGCKRLRVFSFYRGEGQSVQAYAEAVYRMLGELLDAADAQDIVLAHENEKGIYGDIPERCLDLVETFGGRLKCIFDPANFIQCGARPADAYPMLKKHIYYFHMKDALLADGSVVPCGMGDGSVPEILKDYGGDETGLTIEPHLKVFAGLNALQGCTEKLDVRRGRVTILTPHDGEFARLTDRTLREIASSERAELASRFACEHGCILVLKGHRTRIALPDGRMLVNTSGCSALSKGGSGDVLTGLIASLLCQGMGAAEAAVLGVWLHGRAGELLAQEMTAYCASPRELVTRGLGLAFRELLEA